MLKKSDKKLTKEEQLLQDHKMIRESLKDKKRIVVKIGSSSVIHEATGGLDFVKLEKLARYLTDLHNQGKDVVLVSSGAIGMGVKALGLPKRPVSIARSQACAAVGQGYLLSLIHI